jgi:hypothetical protein
MPPVTLKTTVPNDPGNKQQAALAFRGIREDLKALSAAAMTSPSGYLIIDSTHGLAFKDTQSPAHYWGLTVDNTGHLVTTDLGTTPP